MDSDLIKRNLAISYATSGSIRRIDGEDWIRISEVKQSLNEVPPAPQPDFKAGYKQAILDGKTNFSSSHTDEKCKTCKYYLYGFESYPCAHCQRNFLLTDEIREQQNDFWKDGYKQAIPINQEENCNIVCDFLRDITGVDIRKGKKSKWVPVSERLPDVAQRYLVYTKYDDIMTDFFMGDEFIQGNDIIAWQPLPEPYKTDMRGEENE